MTPAEIRAKYADLIKAPLKDWGHVGDCAFFRQKEAEHGPLITVAMTPGFLDLMLEGLGFNYTDPKFPYQPEGLYSGLYAGRWIAQLDRLPALVDFLTERKAIKKLRVRDVIDRAGCAHKLCARERTAAAFRETELSIDDIRAALVQVMAEHPLLNYFGYGRGIGVCLTDLDTLREQLRSDYALSEIRIAVGYLEPLPRLGPHSRKWSSSYTLKHRAEDTVSGYVSNGALIAAALILGIPIKTPVDSPNPLIAVPTLAA